MLLLRTGSWSRFVVASAMPKHASGSTSAAGNITDLNRARNVRIHVCAGTPDADDAPQAALTMA